MIRPKPTYPRYWLSPLSATHIVIEMSSGFFLDLQTKGRWQHDDDVVRTWVELVPGRVHS